MARVAQSQIGFVRQRSRIEQRQRTVFRQSRARHPMQIGVQQLEQTIHRRAVVVGDLAQQNRDFAHLVPSMAVRCYCTTQDSGTARIGQQIRTTGLWFSGRQLKTAYSVLGDH